MEKSAMLLSINETATACESLATKSVKTCDHMECLGKAIDCADAGMMLILKMTNNQLPKAFLKQYIIICEELIIICSKYQDIGIEEVISKCKKSSEKCKEYLKENLHPDHYFLSPLTKMPEMMSA